MSEDQPEERSPTNGPIAGDNDSLFTSVWVKIEVHEDDEEIKTEYPTDTLETFEEPTRQRGRSKKKSDPKHKHLKCELCDYTTRHKNCLAFHTLSHSDAKPFTCDQCNYKTKYPMSLKRHIHVRHQNATAATEQKLRTYKCSMCTYETHFKWNLSSHQRKHDLSKQFKCPECAYTTVYRHSLIKHSRTHNKPGDNVYNCDKCPFSTKYEGHITRHLAKIHFEVSDTAKKCDSCPFSTKMGWRLNIHKKRSLQEKPIQCVHCDYQTMYRCAFKQHRLIHTGGTQGSQYWLESLFSIDPSLHIPNTPNTKDGQAIDIIKMCEIRTKVAMPDTKTEDSNYNDLKSQLDDELYYTINDNDKSNRSIPDTSQQSEHEKNNHYLVDPNCEVAWNNIQVIESPNQDRPFQCITCNYSAKFKASVQRHYQRHHTSQNRPYKCVNCDFSTKTKDQITLHNKRSQSDEILNCKTCGFTSVFKCQFAMHEKEHFPFKCVHCQYTCKKKPDMQKHFMIVHLGNGLKCRYCDFKAIRKESLLCHEAIHTGKKPFQCQLCDYTSVRRSLLENHLGRFHKAHVEMLRAKMAALNNAATAVEKLDSLDVK